jgi:cytochrome c-type biogenesis protein CcmH/NrfF
VKSAEFALLKDPTSYFWTVPYVSLVLGAGVLWIVLLRLRRSKLTPAGARYMADDDPDLARYFEAIEKDAGTFEE